MIKLIIGLVLLSGAAFAKDGYLDRPRACDMPSGPRQDICNAWISTVKRPDYRLASCCGEGDAYIADDFELGPKGELYAIISLDYPDIEPQVGEEQDDGALPPPKASMHRGTRILVPLEKRNVLVEDANRSGHGVVFLFPGTTNVLCYFAPPLI
jgi:hypothetical protein